MENTTLCKIMDGSYAGARDLLMQAAADLDAASTAAREGNRDLARGIAHGAETGLKQALDLIAAIAALQQLGQN